MKRLALYSLLIVAFALSGKTQNSLSFYHLGGTTFQNSFYNPAFIPEGKVFVGLPVLSGVHVNFNNKFSYSDVIVKGELQNQIDLRLLLSNLQKNNMVSTTVSINLFHLGFTTTKDINFSLFANERIEADVLYPKSLIQFAVEGNLAVEGQELKISRTKMSANHFREYGVGFAAPVSDLPVTVGIRAKYLQGFFNGSTSQKFKADLTTNPVDYSLNLDMKNAVLRTSGFGILQGNAGDLGSHLIANTNRGAAIDFGLDMELDKFNSFSFSITDLGFISWKEDINNYTLGDTTFSYSGISLKNPDNLEETIKDSLLRKFENKLTETNDPYTTMLTPKAYGSWTYSTPIGGDVIASVGTRYIQGQFKFIAGAGYRHSFGNVFTGTVNVTRLPQQFLNLGAAFAVKGGPAQFYLAVDQLVNYDVTKFQAIDVRVGLNFIFGSKSEKGPESPFANNEPTTRQNKGGKISTQSFLGSKVKAKGRSGIYTIINRQKRRNPKEYKTEPEDQQ